jgi:hypothetical protein
MNHNLYIQIRNTNQSPDKFQFFSEPKEPATALRQSCTRQNLTPFQRTSADEGVFQVDTTGYNTADRSGD